MHHSYSKCTCSKRIFFIAILITMYRDLLREWKMNFWKLLMAIKSIPNIFNKILNWALYVEYIYVMTFYVWCLTKKKQWQHKWRRDIEFPDIQSFKHMANIFLFHFISPFMFRCPKNKTSSPKRNKLIFSLPFACLPIKLKKCCSCFSKGEKVCMFRCMSDFVEAKDSQNLEINLLRSWKC